MDIVDLNGRQDEPAVLSVLKQSHGPVEALDDARDHYRSGEWLFIGWQEGDEILAVAGAEHHPNATIAINSIAVAPEWRSRGLGRALIDELAERMRADQIVAETDDDAVDFYRSCGFIINDKAPKFGRRRYWCVRALSG